MRLSVGVFAVLGFLFPLTVAAANSETADKKVQFQPETEVAFDHSGKFITHTTEANGVQTADNNGSMQNVTVARLGANGKIETYCTTDKAAAVAWMNATPGKPPIDIDREEK